MAKEFLAHQNSMTCNQMHDAGETICLVRASQQPEKDRKEERRTRSIDVGARAIVSTANGCMSCMWPTQAPSLVPPEGPQE